LAPPPERAPADLVETFFREHAAPRRDPAHPERLMFECFPASELFKNRVVLNQRAAEAADQQSGPRPRISIRTIFRALAERRRGLYDMDVSQAEQLYYRLFYSVRSTLALAEAATSFSPRGVKLGESRDVEFWPSSLEAGFPQYLAIDANGRLHIKPDPTWQQFTDALEAVDASRLRRCPECTAIFYAVRNNTLACPKHTALARVKRAQAHARMREEQKGEKR